VGGASVDKGTAAGKGKGRTPGGQKVGELGDILKEEDEKEGTPKLEGVGLIDNSAKGSGHDGDNKAIGGSVVGLGVSGLTAGTATLATAPAALEAASLFAKKPAYSEPVVSPPANGSAAATIATVPTPEAQEPDPAHEVKAPAPVSEEKTTVAANVKEAEAAPAPASPAESSNPDVVEPAPAPVMDATVPPAQHMETVAESEPGIESHASDKQEQADIPVVTVDGTPVAESEETEVTINVETVEPVPFSETSSVASPVPTPAQPAVVAPEPVDTLVHMEPLRVHENGGAEDHDGVQDAVPVVEVKAIPVEPVGGAPLVEELDSTTEGANGLAQPAGSADPVETVIEAKAEAEEKQEDLLPAPESVVLSGETPGPALTLCTSEPAAVAQAIAATEHEDKAGHELNYHPGSNGSAKLMDPHPTTEPAVESETSASTPIDDSKSSPTPASN
jgi:hypothetical protein